ncbi:MAG: hypothetical protein ACI9WC_000267 [Arenicella sp.]|jgi:hypothetical protein
MFLIILSLFFLWLIYRELKNPTEKIDSFSIAYMAVLALLAFSSARPAYNTWRLEIFLSEKASLIAEREGTKVMCNSLFSTLVDGKGLESLAGTAYFYTGEIYFENGWCKSFVKYLDDPKNASEDEVFSMQVFAHEVMHIRGERNERKTDCQAIQRNHHIGEMLGVDPFVARKNALRYYNNLYPRHPYYDEECRPRGKYDERLDNSIWSK